MRKIYYRDAVREALDEEMARDPMVMMIGEDVGPNGGTWKANLGLWEKYGDLRMKDSPISESGIVGMGVGMALTGMRPIVEIMFSDFMLVAMDQIANQMAKITYMSGGQRGVPMVIRTTIGLGRASAAQHSQCLNSLLAYFPGMKIAVPSDAYTAKGLLKTAIRDNAPVVVVEHRMQYSQQFDMPAVDQHLAGIRPEVVLPQLAHFVLDEIQFLLVQADFLADEIGRASCRERV